MDALGAAPLAAGVEDEQLLSAIATMPRSEFVPAERAGPGNVHIVGDGSPGSDGRHGFS